MTLNMNRYRAVAALIVSLFVCAGASAQQYNIRLNYSPGDKFEFATQEEFKTKISVSSGQMVLQEFDQVMNKRRAGTMEVLAAENGRPTSIRVTYERGLEDVMEQMGQQQRKPFPFAGESAVLSWKPDRSLDLRTNVQTDDVEALGELRQMLDPDDGLFPRGPVKVGDRWEAGKDAVAKSFQLGPNDTGSGEFRLVDVRDVNGRETAEIECSVAMKKNEQGMMVSIAMKGAMLIDLATGHLVGGQLAGPITLQGDQMVQGQDGQQMQLSLRGNGDGTAKSQARVVAGGQGGGGDIRPQPRPRPDNGGGDNPLARRKTGPSFAGNWAGDGIELSLQQNGESVRGTLAIDGSEFPVDGRIVDGRIQGTFDADGQKFEFVAEPKGDGLVLESDGTTYNLSKRGGGGGGSDNPLARPKRPSDDM
jgi:hypothetical protein